MIRSILNILFSHLFFLLFIVNINANELNLEVQHEDDPSDRMSNEEENENNLLPPLIKDKNNKNMSIKGNMMITEEFLKTKEVDGAEIKVKVKTD